VEYKRGDIVLLDLNRLKENGKYNHEKLKCYTFGLAKVESKHYEPTDNVLLVVIPLNENFGIVGEWILITNRDVITKIERG